MDDSSFPTYQWSKFINGGRDEQFVVRSNSIEDFKLQISNIRAMIPATPQTPVVTPQATLQATPTSLSPICPTHNKEMRPGKFGFYCPTKVDDGWCQYRPVKK